MSDPASITLDRELDEVIELLEGKRVLDFLSVVVNYSDDEATRQRKCEAAAAAQGYSLDAVRTLVTVQKFGPDDIVSERPMTEQDQLASRELMEELEVVSKSGSEGTTMGNGNRLATGR